MFVYDLPPNSFTVKTLISHIIFDKPEPGQYILLRPSEINLQTHAYWGNCIPLFETRPP